ncbi:MAG: FixH family protein, partial [Saprospiraceae bacterium]|nr:FixH family protein [Saprospiraceae bacterium]
HYDRLENSRQLERNLEIRKHSSGALLELAFPSLEGEIGGEIQFFCPSTSQYDFSLPVQVDQQNKQRIRIDDLRKGMWRIKVEWHASDRKFYKEEQIVI